MREIKFRAWDMKLGMWIPDLCVTFRGDIMKTGTRLKYEGVHRRKLALMQYTGLKDKNGKEIYEGDVLGNEDDASLLVWWNGDYACWAAKDPIGREDFGLLKNAFEDASASYEVIGNIYENSELLG